MSEAGAIDILSVVPHSGRMLLVDALLASDADAVAVSALVRPDNPFAEATGVPAWVGIEYMAQAVAAWAGCRALERGERARIGFLLGTRRYEASCTHFRFGAQLRIEAVRELFGENGLGMFTCRILEGQSELARANLSVYEPPDAAAFLESQSE